MIGGEAPQLLDRTREADEREFLALTRGDRVQVFDTLGSQACELIRARNPGRAWTPAELHAETQRLVGQRPDHYGTWVHFPWSRRLVHVLPKREYRELRTSRNRNKITTDEQRRLGQAKVGVVGLSVGQATAVTLALEGIGGELRLADQDQLALSNLNRLRAGVHEIGVNKAAITARAIYEVDPYAELVLFRDGVQESNLDAFLDGLDLLFEECDDLAMKVRVREAARARRIPVVMETSDRGMLDVERFDLEPDRRILHGLVGDVDARSLRGLSTAEKVPFVLALIGDVSPRAAASLVDIETTLETWPQLASAVALGGAVNVDSARRILLGSFRESGRFYVDLERIAGAPEGTSEESPAATTPPPEPVAARAGASASNGHSRDPAAAPEVETIVSWASLAPSGGNCQPWRFVQRRGESVLECWHERQRSASLLDFDDRASYVALGAALENARLACVRLGLAGRFERMPGPPGLAWTLHLGTGALRAGADDDKLAAAVESRGTNRRIADRRPLPAGIAEALAAAAAEAGAELHLWTEPNEVTALGELVARSEKLRMLHAGLHRDMVRELRWSAEEAQRTRDGIDIATLELTAADTAGLTLLRSPAVVREIRRVGGGEGLKKASRKAAGAASAIGLLSVAGPRSHSSYLRGGEALQRVWLLAHGAGVSLQPMTAILYLLARAEDGGGAQLDESDRSELDAIRSRLEAVAGPRRGAEIMLMRFAIAPPPSARALRRSVADLLSAG